MNKKAFTLIEVMVAVVIISVVIMTLLKINANDVFLFSKFKAQTKTNEYLSLLIGTNYGFLNEDVTLDKLVPNFDLEYDLRQKLKNTKVQLIYQELQKIDTGSFGGTDTTQDMEDSTSSSSAIYETGKTILKTKKASSTLLRIQLK